MVTLESILLTHCDPNVQSLLANALQGDLRLPLELAPASPEGLRRRLETTSQGVLVLDIDIIPAVIGRLRVGRYHLVVVAQTHSDPRGAKLAQWGGIVLTPQEVPAYFAQWASTQRPSSVPQVFTPLEGSQVTILHSAKGGVGTSTLAVHLASIWARQGQSVALVDVAPYGSASLLCKAQQRDIGLEPLLARVESNQAFLDAEDCDLSPFFTSVLSQPGRLDLLAGARPRILDRLRPDTLERLLNRLRHMPYDQIVVDTSSVPAAHTLAAVANADRLLLVATPDYTCGWNLVSLKEMLELLPRRAEQLLALNLCTPGVGMTPAEYTSRLGIPVACQIPVDGQIPRLSNQGVPWSLPENSPFLQSMLSLANTLESRSEVAFHG